MAGTLGWRSRTPLPVPILPHVTEIIWGRDAGLPYVVMEDIIDQCTIEEAELVFTYLETRIQSLHRMHASFIKSPGKLAVLRICNQLLRRCLTASTCSL